MFLRLRHQLYVRSGREKPLARAHALAHAVEDSLAGLISLVSQKGLEM
jgi:hypothetical protein